MSSFLTEKHKLAINSILNDIVLDVVEASKNSDNSNDFSTLYDIQDYLGQFLIAEFSHVNQDGTISFFHGVVYPDNTHKLMSHLLRDVEARKKPKAPFDLKDPWDLGE